MPDSDATPTLPRDTVPPSTPEEDQPTIPHSLAPLSGSSAEEPDAAGEPAWREVWRRRWFVAGASMTAFLVALALGRLNAVKHSPMPPSTVTGASLPSGTDVPASAQSDRAAAPAPASAAAAPVRTETPTPIATSTSEPPTLEIPPTEVPPQSGVAGSRKSSAGRATKTSGTAPSKRFVPNRI